MKIRPIRVVPENERFSPKTREAAERAFIRALEREKVGGPARAVTRPRASTLGPAGQPSRRQGQSFGAAFANINAADYDRAVTYARALDRGAREAQRREDGAREAAQDPDALRAMGFHGRDDDEDL